MPGRSAAPKRELIITHYPVDRAVQLRLLEENVPYLLLNSAP